MQDQRNYALQHHHYLANCKYSSSFKKLFEVLYRKFDKCDKQNKTHINESIKKL